MVIKFVGAWSKHIRVFPESLRQSSVIFGNFRTCSATFVWPSDKFWRIFVNLRKWSEIFEKSSKSPSLVCLCNKKNITRYLEDMNFMFSWQEQYLTSSLRSLVRYCSTHWNIKFISSRHRVISSFYWPKSLVSANRQFSLLREVK